MTGNLIRLAVGIGSSACRANDSPVPRCRTAMATLPWCASASAASRSAKEEEDSPQRYKGHKEDKTRGVGKNLFMFLFLFSLCPLCLCGESSFLLPPAV